MSLISTKNFAAPFTNRVHLIAILLVSVLFATFRLSGGNLEMRGAADERAGYQGVETRAPASDLIFGGEDTGVRREPSPAREERAPVADVQRPPINHDVMRDLLANRSREAPGTLRAPDRGEEKKPNDTGLDDIERRLGMR